MKSIKTVILLYGLLLKHCSFPIAKAWVKRSHLAAV